MSKMKFISASLLVLAILFAQVGTAFAAPAAQDTTTITGTVTAIVPETDTNGVTTVLVTLDNMGQVQTVRISLDTALSLGLVTVDPVTKAVTAVDPAGLPSVAINPMAVIPDEEENVHPIAAILASFFGMEAGAVNDLHEEGFGFGVIAQSLWISRNLTSTEDTAGDASLVEDILTAKQSKNYDAFFVAHPEYLDKFEDGTPTNWGQFKKVLLNKKNNLGVIVSGHADNNTEDSLTQQNIGQGKDKDKNPGKGKGNRKKP